MDRIESKLKSNQLLDDGLRTWQEFKDLRLSDGSPDEAKAEAKIMARTDIATEQKLKLVQAYKGFAAEDVKNRAAQDAARDRTFLNGIVKAKSEGVPMSEVLRQASGYSKDPYQQSLREETIKKLYAPPTESDHAVHNKLWTEVQEGRGSIAAIDAAYGQGKLSPQNWESLRQGQYKVTANGSDPEHKAAWDRIGILADEKYGSDKKSKEQFLFVMHQKSGKLSAPELINLATDQLKKDPSTGWFSFTQDRKWGAELQKVDASNSAFGKLYEDVGQDEITAIGRGALFSGKKSWGPADVDSFANAFGGYNAIKKGTPVNNAIQSIVRRNGLVTVKNINAVLKAHPDGNY
jgi:hypothetical protein